MKEEYRFVRIDGMLTKYSISNYGNLISYNHGRKKTIKQSICKNGYVYVGIYHNKKIYNTTIHRLMAFAFLNLSENSDLVVNHIDGNKSNNNINNLEIITQSENQIHAIKNGLRKRTLSKEDVKNIRDSQNSLLYLSKKYNLTKDFISSVKKGKSYKDIK